MGNIILKGLLPVGKYCQIDLASIPTKTQYGLNYIIVREIIGGYWECVLKLSEHKAVKAR